MVCTFQVAKINNNNKSRVNALDNSSFFDFLTSTGRAGFPDPDSKTLKRLFLLDANVINFKNCSLLAS